MEHKFNVDLAKMFDIQSAILLENIYYWTIKNMANNVHNYEGRYWVYNSKKAWALLFPYMTERQVDYTITKLVNANVLAKGNFNSSLYDRTLWYALTDNGITILQNCGYHFTKLSNGDNKIVQPIPIDKLIKENNIKDNITKENKSRIPTYEEIVEYFKERQTNIDPKEFYDYYQSVGWFRGNTKITNWKNCLTTWETKRKKKPQQQPTQQVHSFEERTYTEEDYDQVVTSIDNIDFNDL